MAGVFQKKEYLTSKKWQVLLMLKQIKSAGIFILHLPRTP